MRAAALCVLAALSMASHAESKPDQRLYSTAPDLRVRPNLYVYLGKYWTYPQSPTNPFPGYSMQMEWTANGQPMPSNLVPFHADCIYRSGQQYSCQALTNWFRDAPRYGGRERISSEYPEAFYLPAVEFNSEYCFRFKADRFPANDAPWTQWSCLRTKAAPELPPAPARPQLTVIPESSGKGTVGAGHPTQVLVEWDRSSSEELVAGYTVEQESYGKFSKEMFGFGEKTGKATYETTVDLLPSSDPEGIYAFRVCATNISGKSCSPVARTPGRPWADKALPGGKAAALPVTTTGDTFNATAKRHTPLPSDAAVPAAGAKPVLDEAWRSKNAARGEILAGQDPLAAELRNSLPEGPRRLGFDFGMAVAEGETLPGPGKQAIHDALAPEEQFGFARAVRFSLERNANGELAAKGAAILAADPSVAAVRDSAADSSANVAGVADAAMFYKLGFNIATGLFGDPALGSAGNTAMGPGSMRIRNSLAIGAEQSGFDDAVTFHLRHDYAR